MGIDEIDFYKQQFQENGYAVIPDVFSMPEIKIIAQLIRDSDTSKDTFRKSADLFAIRQFLKEVPGIVDFICSTSFLLTIRQFFGEGYFVTKSIYFDKPGVSNWFVAWHQDLTISVDKKTAVEGFGPWTTKQNQFGVQPPLSYIENNFTVRIHLDETNIDNGALKVIPGSQKKGIWRPDMIDQFPVEEAVCNVPAGGIMLMHPLLMHSSGRTINNKQRRVIHIEFSNKELPGNLNWSEKIILNGKNETIQHR